MLFSFIMLEWMHDTLQARLGRFLDPARIASLTS